jgi:hypothetical protein
MSIIINNSDDFESIDIFGENTLKIVIRNRIWNSKSFKQNFGKVFLLSVESTRYVDADMSKQTGDTKYSSVREEKNTICEIQGHKLKEFIMFFFLKKNITLLRIVNMCDKDDIKLDDIFDKKFFMEFNKFLVEKSTKDNKNYRLDKNMDERMNTLFINIK